jgi:putative oxidoreductase
MYFTRKTDAFALTGRILLSIIFIVSAVAKILEWNGTVQMMAAKGIPLAPVALALATAIELVGGLAMLAGFGPGRYALGREKYLYDQDLRTARTDTPAAAGRV